MNKQELEQVTNQKLGAMIDEKAKELGYNSAADLASYTASTNADFKAEAETFVAWRDGVYSHMIDELANLVDPDGPYTREGHLADIYNSVPTYGA